MIMGRVISEVPRQAAFLSRGIGLCHAQFVHNKVWGLLAAEAVTEPRDRADSAVLIKASG
jgi:hypothetical protein